MKSTLLACVRLQICVFGFRFIRSWLHAQMLGPRAVEREEVRLRHNLKRGSGAVQRGVATNQHMGQR